jgi:hypothetical protein
LEEHDPGEQGREKDPENAALSVFVCEMLFPAKLLGVF